MARNNRNSLTFAERLGNDEDYADMLCRHRRDGVDHWTGEWDEYTKLQRYANQQQWPGRRPAPAGSVNAGSSGGPGGDSASRAPRLVFDRTSPIIQMASGKQIVGRFERAYLPRHNSAQRASEILSAVDRALMQSTDDEQVTSAAFKDGPVIQGASCVRWQMDDLHEKGGWIIKRHLPMWQVMVDPNSREINFSDRAWHRYGEWWPQSEVRARWPEKYDEITGAIGASSWSPDEQHESSRIPWVGMAGNRPFNGEYYPAGRSFWVEYEEWREVATQWVVAVPADESMSYKGAMEATANREAGAPATDPFTERTFETAAELKDFKDSHEAAFAEPVPREFIAPRRRLIYKYAYVVGDTVVEVDNCRTNYWTMQFMTGFRFPQPTKTVFRSLLSRLVDPQKFINVMMSMLLRNLQISPKGLLFIEEGWFGANSDEFRDQWAAPGGVMVLKRGALTGGGSPGYRWESGGGSSPYTSQVESLLTFYKDSLPEIAGFNPGALGQLGSDLRRISGEVVRQVADAAMTANAELFDSLRLYSREGGRINLSFLRAFFSVEDLIQIVGEEVAYEPVMVPVPPQPAIDPTTGQPAVDPATGQPLPPTPALDPQTGEQLMKPATNPDGSPVMQLVMPGEEAWSEDYWKQIAVEDVQPVDDQRAMFWKAIQSSAELILAPQADTGMPLLGGEDLIEMMPLPAYIRSRSLQRYKARKTFAWQQSQQQAQQPAPQQPPGGGGEQPPQQ